MLRAMRSESVTPSGLIVTGSSPGGLLIGGTKPLDNLWRCPFCDVTYGDGQSRAIARHMDTEHRDDIGAQYEARLAEPHRQRDDEQIEFLKRKAVAEGDPTVRGH